MMPSSRGQTSPRNAPVSSTANTPDTFMSFVTPSGTPASPETSVPSNNRDSHDKAKVRSVPAHLRFFLGSNVNLDTRLITKALIGQIIVHFEPTTNITANMGKPALKCLFYERVAPVIRRYNSVVNNVDLTPSPRPFSPNRPLDYQEYAHAFNPTFDPNHRTSTKAVLHAAIQHKCPNQRLPALNLIKKPALIALFQRHVHQAPPPRARFAHIPPVLAAAELQGQTKDELRFALQAHLPHLFVLSHVPKHVLINIYRRFMLGEPDAEGDPAQIQVDFFLFNNEAA